MKSLRVRAWVVCGIAVLAALPALAGGDESKNAANPAQDPFYRKYLVAGNPLDDEILSMEQKVEDNPNDATLRNDFGNLLALRRFSEQAAEQYEMAAKLDKTNFIAYYNLGILREAEGKTGAAISAYQKSIARKPGFPQSRFRLGRLYELQGKLDAAVEQYAKALRIDPSMRNPKRNPLVIDSALMYRVTLANYERDIARVTLDRDVSFVEEPAFRHLPVDHAISSEAVAAPEARRPRRAKWGRPRIFRGGLRDEASFEHIAAPGPGRGSRPAAARLRNAGRSARASRPGRARAPRPRLPTPCRPSLRKSRRPMRDPNPGTEVPEPVITPAPDALEPS